jgi:pyruvate dehydrogenase (quinone)
VDTIFGIPGDGINGFMEARRKRRDEVRFVHTRLSIAAANGGGSRAGVAAAIAGAGALVVLAARHRR